MLLEGRLGGFTAAAHRRLVGDLADFLCALHEAVPGVIDFGDCGIGDLHDEFASFGWMDVSLIREITEAYSAGSGHTLDSTRARDLFCLKQLRDAMGFGPRRALRPWERAMHARALANLEHFAALDAAGDW